MYAEFQLKFISWNQHEGDTLLELFYSKKQMFFFFNSPRTDVFFLKCHIFQLGFRVFVIFIIINMLAFHFNLF